VVCIAERGAAAGALAGAITGALAAGIVKGLFEIRPPAFTANRQVIPPQNITSTPTTLLPSTNYKFAIVFFHGDGDPTLTLTVRRGNQTFTLAASSQALEMVINESLEIVASSGSGMSPTIEIGSLS